MRPSLVGAVVCLLAAACPARAYDMTGRQIVTLHTRDGRSIAIGTVDFTPAGDKTAFRFELDASPFRTFFLSMRNFSCIQGAETQCYVAYPYRNAGLVTKTDLSWLEDALLFFYKTPTDYGAAKLNNGIIYALTPTAQGLVGTPLSIDLDEIAAPPDDPTKPPFPPADRGEMGPRARWIDRLTIAPK